MKPDPAKGYGLLLAIHETQICRCVYVLFMDAFYSEKGHDERSKNDWFKSGFQKSFP